MGGRWPLNDVEAMVPQLPSYLQDIAWRKQLPHELQCSVQLIPWMNRYPRLRGVSHARPEPVLAKYVNYQTDRYAIEVEDKRRNVVATFMLAVTDVRSLSALSSPATPLGPNITRRPLAKRGRVPTNAVGLKMWRRAPPRCLSFLSCLAQIQAESLTTYAL